VSASPDMAAQAAGLFEGVHQRKNAYGFARLACLRVCVRGVRCAFAASVLQVNVGIGLLWLHVLAGGYGVERGKHHGRAAEKLPLDHDELVRYQRS
jgi:hypothetical protein